VPKGPLTVFLGVGLVWMAAPPATVKPDRFDASEAGVRGLLDAPRLLLLIFDLQIQGPITIRQG
jgi:hypothetical protein